MTQVFFFVILNVGKVKIKGKIVMTNLLIPKKVAIIYYDRFAPLDVFGPLQAMNCSFYIKEDGCPDESLPLFENFSIARNIGMVKIGRGGIGPEIFCSNNFDTVPSMDIVLIPGGMGSRVLAKDDSFIRQLKTFVLKTPIVLSVCTGALLLAKTGYLDNKIATTNKRAYKDVVNATNASIKWQCPPRWIGNIDKASQSGYMTSGGVAAGIEKQEANNEKLEAQGAQRLQEQQMAEKQRIQGIQISEGGREQMANAQGRAFEFSSQENRDNMQLNRMAGQEAQARQDISTQDANMDAAISAGISGLSSGVQAGASMANSNNQGKLTRENDLAIAKLYK